MYLFWLGPIRCAVVFLITKGKIRNRTGFHGVRISGPRLRGGSYCSPIYSGYGNSNCLAASNSNMLNSDHSGALIPV